MAFVHLKIRGKLLVMLLVIALAPLVVASLFQRMSMRQLGAELAARSREALIDDAQHHLYTVVDDYSRVLARSKMVLELALKQQAAEVERRLAGESPVTPGDLGVDLVGYDPCVPAYVSPVHADRKEEGVSQEALDDRDGLSYQHQGIFLAKESSRSEAADQLARLAGMTAVYWELYDSTAETVLWQYTSLETGLHMSYPGGGRLPDPERYDPRLRPWYLKAKQTGDLVWVSPYVDASTGKAVLTLAMPIYHTDGVFAGVTAMDLSLPEVFQGLRLPTQWLAHAEKFLVTGGQPGTVDEGKLIVAVSARQSLDGQGWRTNVEWGYLESDDPAGLAELARQSEEGGAGVRWLPYRGRECLWAYGTCLQGRAFPIVIIPREHIVSRAQEAESYIHRQTMRLLEITGLILAGVVLLVILIAVGSSRSVTEPIRQLTQAGQRLADGDFEARVVIDSGDELQELGDIFNRTGPQLKEREQMKQSLLLAQEIQQHLLPHKAPSVRGFEIAGKSIYCDETGGDYYDFIELVDRGADCVGIALGDVTGHGIGAALLMASARAVLRSQAGQNGGAIAPLIGTLNQHLARDTGDSFFMTLFYGLLDARSRTLQWASAGHDPAFHVRPSHNVVEELTGETGLPLGVVGDERYEACGPVSLETGDVVVIGTDGIWEAHNDAGEMFGKDRLRQVLLQNVGLSAEDTAEAVLDAVRGFVGSHVQSDDITLVVVKAL